ncbi:hypothetical protein PVAG01_06955 [Phlyctema vagabunda]|uniref:P-loop containing nucleoside triphosphate hydrolase protein n=1 Tax=Phlyctema vagabunda TaxID=108571 RepID=A0ABR4PB31_9HELO
MSLFVEQCSIEAEGQFGPQVSDCRDNFDFTLLFEETILYLAPLLIAAIIISFRIWQLHKRENRLYGGVLHILKQIGWVVFILLQLVHFVLSLVLKTSTTRVTNVAIGLGFLVSLEFGLLSMYEHLRSVRPSTLLNVYILGTIPMDAARARTLWSMPNNIAIAAVFTSIVSWKFILLLLEAKEKRSLLRPFWQSAPPEETGGILNRSFFWWFNPLLLAGNKNELTVEGLFHIDSDLSFEAKEAEMRERWANTDITKPNALPKVLIGIYKWPLLAGVLPRLSLTGLTYAQPFLINRAIRFIVAPNTSKSAGYGIIAAYAIVYIGIGVVGTMSQHKTYRALTMIRGCLVSFIYHQTLDLSSSSLSESASLTLMTADVERVGSGMRTMHDSWASIIEIGLALWLLEMQLGVATVAAVAVSVACIVANIKLAMIAGGRQKVWLEAIQERISATVSALGAMKGIKMTGATKMMYSAITELRASEIRLSKKFRQLLIAVVTLSYVSTTMSPVFGFGTYSILSSLRDTIPLNAAIAYTSLTLFSLLGQAMSLWIEAIIGVVTAIASLERIREYLASDARVDPRTSLPKLPHVDLYFHHDPSSSMLELQEVDIRKRSRLVGDVEEVITVRNCSASWAEGTPPVLSNINLSVKRGELTMIIGPIGSGKSTLLKAVLGEMPETSGSIVVHGNEVAFCPQVAWLTNASIKDNIIGQLDFDFRWYNTVVNACALDIDFAQLPNGDNSMIGSKGIILSGGQKTRVSLARTVYARKDIAVLDDVFSGLDAKTELHVFSSLFGPEGILRQSQVTTILATNSTRNISHADHIVALGADGTITEQGSYEELASAGGYLQSLETNDTSGTMTGLIDEKEINTPPPAVAVAGEIDQSRRTGDMTIYKYYIDTIGWVAWLVFVAFCAVFVFALIFPQFWIKWWTEQNFRGPRNSRTAYYVSLYAVWGILAIVMFICAVWHFMINIVPKSAQKFHTALLDTVMAAPMQFFSVTDTGETSNRFSQDLELIDMELPLAIIGTTVTLLSSIGQLITICIGSRWVAATIPALAVLLFYVQKFYLRTSRQLRILDIEAKAPLLSHFIETINGSIAIRAFGWTKEYREKNVEILEMSQRPYYLLYCAQRWLNLILDMVVAFIAIILVSIAVTKKDSSGALLGLALTSIVGFGQNLKGLIASWTSLEISMGAIARVRHFTTTTESEDLPGENTFVPREWPEDGSIKFSNVSAAYGSSSDLVLKNITLDIRPTQKLGICGRTGSGKSSLISTLLRLIEMTEGSITIDGIDISTINRQELRSRLITLPQEAFFLSASLRYNLDPTRLLPDDKLNQVLADIGLYDVIEKKGGLDSMMSDDLLSHGQRQLLCLARAMLQAGKILILDEATSSVDSKTEEMMQDVIRDRFRDHTIICIAHKLRTIVEFDHVIVLDEGRIVESGNPRDLMLEPSIFAELLRASNGEDEEEEGTEGTE